MSIVYSLSGLAGPGLGPRKTFALQVFPRYYIMNQNPSYELELALITCTQVCWALREIHIHQSKASSTTHRCLSALSNQAPLPIVVIVQI